MAMDIHLMDELIECVENSDIVFAASSSETVILGKEDAEKMKLPDSSMPRRIIDIAVPRNISSSINEVQNNIVHNVDDLIEVVNMN